MGKYRKVEVDVLASQVVKTGWSGMSSGSLWGYILGCIGLLKVQKVNEGDARWG